MAVEPSANTTGTDVFKMLDVLAALDSSQTEPVHSPADLYQYDPLPTSTSIRLVNVLERDGSSGLIKCSIQTVDLVDRPHYNCLSYTWGNPMPDGSLSPEEVATYSADNKKPILCNGKLLFVTRNLHDVLERLPNWKCPKMQEPPDIEGKDKSLYWVSDGMIPGELAKLSGLRWQQMVRLPRRASSGHHEQMDEEKHNPIWIDAICINQGDLDERSAQVRIMGRIYQSAQIVFAWLGREDADVDEALKVFDSLVFERYDEKMKFFDLQTALKVDKKEAKNLLEIPRYSRAQWKACCMFLQRNWFARLWVLQEASSSPPKPITTLV